MKDNQSMDIPLTVVENSFKNMIAIMQGQNIICRIIPADYPSHEEALKHANMIVKLYDTYPDMFYAIIKALPYLNVRKMKEWEPLAYENLSGSIQVIRKGNKEAEKIEFDKLSELSVCRAKFYSHSEFNEAWYLLSEALKYKGTDMKICSAGYAIYIFFIVSEPVKRTRKEIRDCQAKIKRAITQLEGQYCALQVENNVLCDEQQWYEEKTEVVGRGKKKKEILVGRIHWNEDFIDEETNEKVTIERIQTVRENGEWL